MSSRFSANFSNVATDEKPALKLSRRDADTQVMDAPAFIPGFSEENGRFLSRPRKLAV
jgi:hypothetical protein